jgi:low affinity Fe/Cu permease
MTLRQSLSRIIRRRARPEEVSPIRPTDGDRSGPRDAPASQPTFDDATIHEYEDEIATPRRSIKRRTSQLPIMSKMLYRIDYYASLPIVSVSVVGAFAVMLLVGIFIGFPMVWVNTFEVTVSSVTLLMVFTIQHTQGREQAATQRKLDELLRATPGAAEALMMLEEAPREFMLEVEDKQRGVRADLVDDVDVREADVGPGGAAAK